MSLILWLKKGHEWPFTGGVNAALPDLAITPVCRSAPVARRLRRQYKAIHGRLYTTQHTKLFPDDCYNTVKVGILCLKKGHEWPFTGGVNAALPDLEIPLFVVRRR